MAKVRISTSKAVALATAIVLFAGVTIAAYYFAERFLIRDPRFALYGSGAAAPSFHVQGIQYASAREIEAVFAGDLGRSVYSIPLEDRRHYVRAVAWVRDASVARLWPNRVLVHVTERVPVAFLMLPSSHLGLIDADGAVMPQPEGEFDLPMLTGVRVGDPLETRRAGAARLLRVLNELGEDAREVSEVDVGDAANTVITVAYDGRLLRLQLGDRDFAARFDKFRRHQTEIRQHMPAAKTLDLRLEDRIPAVEQ